MSNSRVLPTLAEFQKAIQEYRRAENISEIFAIATAFLGCLIVYLLHSILYPEVQDLRLLPVFFMAIFACCMIWIVIRSKRCEKQYPLILCRGCNKLLQPQSGIVIATGNCPHCGQRAIEIPALPANDDPLPPRMTRAEFLAATERKVAWTKTSLNMSVFGSLGFTILIAGIYHALDGRNRPLPFQFLPALAVAIVVIPWLYWCRRRIDRPLPQDSLLECPNCSAALATNLVSATGKCQACCRVVFSDSPDVLAALKENPLA